MGNLIKYEIKGNIKELLGLISVIILGNLFIFFRIGKFGITSGNTLLVINNIIAVAATVVVFIWNVKMFTRSLNDDTGYLEYNLPVSSNKLIGSKVIWALIQQAIVMIICVLFIGINFYKVGAINNLKLSEVFTTFNINFIIYILLVGIIYYIQVLTAIYFSVSLSRVAIKKKRKIAKLGSWVIFIILSIIISKAIDFIERVFPNSVAINIFSNNPIFKSDYAIYNINTASTIFDFILIIVFFLGTSYLIRKKVDI